MTESIQYLTLNVPTDSSNDVDSTSLHGDRKSIKGESLYLDHLRKVSCKYLGGLLVEVLLGVTTVQRGGQKGNTAYCYASSGLI